MAIFTPPMVKNDVKDVNHSNKLNYLNLPLKAFCWSLPFAMVFLVEFKENSRMLEM